MTWRAFEQKIEDFLSRDGWAIETQNGDHLTIQYVDDDEEGPSLYKTELTINITALARHLADGANA